MYRLLFYLHISFNLSDHLCGLECTIQSQINCVNYSSLMQKYRIIAFLSLGLGIGSALSYFLKRQANPPEQPKHLTLETTLKIAQQIKYQMIKVSLTFATEVASKLMKAIQPSQLKIASEKLRQNLIKIYEQKEANILAKYEIQKEAYGLSLQRFEDNPKVDKIKKNILQMIEDAIKGQIPDLTVAQQALKLHSLEEVISVFRELQSNIAVLVWMKITNLMHNDVSFNLKSQQHFRKMLHELDVYTIKVDFLTEKGYKSEWGCPNETFLKVVEIYKGESKDFLRRITAIDRAYQSAIDIITSAPDTITKEQIVDRLQKAEPEYD